jgi:hypothetical protein
VPHAQLSLSDLLKSFVSSRLSLSWLLI